MGAADGDAVVAEVGVDGAGVEAESLTDAGQ